MPENLISSARFPLAIVIPAYKAKYLREALQAIAAQTDQRFQVYLGDDCSPEPVAEVVREFSHSMRIVYHRFDDNLGGKSLVQQWERCLRLTREPWIWLFSDDDFMDSHCVAAFYSEWERSLEKYDAYRFNTTWVDGESRLGAVSPWHPPEESGAEFLLARLAGFRKSSMQEIIFSRQAWEMGGGIPDFPLAWCSDDAFIAQLGARRPLRTISGPQVYWRLSDVNISNNKSAATTRTKITASSRFIRWVMTYFARQPEAARQEAVRLTEVWFLVYIANTWQYLSLSSTREFEDLARTVWRHPPGWAFGKALALNFQHGKRRMRDRWQRRRQIWSKFFG